MSLGSSDPSNKVSPIAHPWCDPQNGVCEPKSVDEWLIIRASKRIRDDPNWKLKFRDPEYISERKAEFVSNINDSQEPWMWEVHQLHAKYLRNIDAIFEYVQKELEWYEAKEQELVESGFVHSINERVLYSDIAISTTTQSNLRVAIQNFEVGTENICHSIDDEVVVNIIDPCMYPVVYGQTQELRDGKLSTIQFNEKIYTIKNNVPEYAISKHFQCLPTKFKYDESAGRFELSSYINNIHPGKYAEIYTLITTIFNNSLPGLLQCLSCCISPEYLRVNIPVAENAYGQGYLDMIHLLEDSDLEASDGEKIDEELELKKHKWIKDSPPKWNGSPSFQVFDAKRFEDLKVITKLVNIELTPENPQYVGGSWHVEGAMNEDIVATITYHYDSENVTNQKLSFRESFKDPKFHLDDAYYCRYYYGLSEVDQTFKYSGSEDSPLGRVLIFPNVFQHKLDPFELKDKSKSGHRKIMYLFVVDPYNNIIKTTDSVPPQQDEWAHRLESKHFIHGDVNNTNMTYEEAKKFLDNILAERKTMNDPKAGRGESSTLREFWLWDY